MAPILPWLIPAILSAGGSVWNNIQNRKQAHEQMAFQERMSSTAAQRSREDYERAGLNPALAYERTASSPGGAMANLEDPLSKGVHSALSARALMKDLQLADADIALKRSQATAADASQEQARTQAALNFKQTQLGQQMFAFNEAQQPVQLRIQAAQALVQELLGTQEALKIPGMRNTARHEEAMGRAGPIIGTARTLSEIIKGLGGVIRR